MCLGAIYWARLDKIYYANTKRDAARVNFDDDFIFSELGLSIEERKLPTVQLLRDEAQIAFTKWSESTSKKVY
jgi:tRNA(Arg) A34 adenosine deaminase TadA